jgi:uracil-DNA glycosylase
MFVGENPSWADHQQTPFSETTISGRALRRYYLEPLGLRESDVWITDLFKSVSEKGPPSETIQRFPDSACCINLRQTMAGL